MRVKVLTKFKDKHTGVVYKKGDCLTMTEERYKEILQVGQFVYKISEPCRSDAEALEDDATTNPKEYEEKPAETASGASGDGFDAMSVRELREYADKAHKMTFGRNTKKAEMIETLRKMEQGK